MLEVGTVFSAKQRNNEIVLKNLQYAILDHGLESSDQMFVPTANDQ